MTLRMFPTPLSFGMGNADVVLVQQALQALGRDVPPSERGVLGASTVAVLKALQVDLGLPPSGIVDAATVRAINIRLAKLATDPRVVQGFVRGINRSTNDFVQIFGQGPNGERVIGKSTINASDGSYQISYQPASNGNGHVDLRVAVLNSSGDIVKTAPSGASILTNAGPLEVVNFVLDGTANQPLSEFERILAELKPLLGQRNLADLTKRGHDVSLLARQSGYGAEKVAALVLAHKLENETRGLATTTPAVVFYGLLRAQLSTDTRGLFATHKDVLRNALESGLRQGVVPKEVGGRKIEAFLAAFVPAAPAGLQRLLGPVLNAKELDTFVGQFLKDNQTPEAFWQTLASDPALAGRAAELKRTIQLAALFDNNVLLVNAVKAMPDIKEARDLARFTAETWTSLIKAQRVGVPPDTPGATAEEKIQNYAQQIDRQVEAAFPTAVLAERLGASPVATFLKDQPSYDLQTTYPEQFFRNNPAAAQVLGQKGKGDLVDVQRARRLTGTAKDAIALAARGFGSAGAIARIDPKDFAKRNQDVLSGARAKEIHDRALRTNATALALLEHSTSLNRTALHALPQLNTLDQKNQAKNIPDWETLFGAFDLCACQECSAAHGPAAYFVDVLKFLSERRVDESSERTVKDALFERRPDLGDIELSCENTNTVVPVTDLANEVLENAVSPPPPFAAFTLVPALEAALTQPVATTALAAAFNPPLQPATQVETLEAGKRWRIWDEPFAYEVVKENTVLRVIARSRQTTSGERLATPQYRNGAAYAELSRAVYPWNLPFDLPTEEADVFLAHLGVSRHDLMEALRLGSGAFNSTSTLSVRLAAERLGLTDTERQIIVGEPLAPPRPPEDLWGSTPVAALSTVRELLDRSGLSYAQLEALITTWFIDPGKTVAISAKTGEPVATCDTTQLQIGGLTTEVLSRLHRFVRLQRTLGWTTPEVDKSIRAFVADPSIPSLTNEVLVRLDHVGVLRSQLRLSVAQTLALWKPIDTDEPASLYRSLFSNPAVFNPLIDDFRLGPDGKELVQSAKFLTEQATALQAVFRLSSASFALLVAKTNGRLTLGNLSIIYRHATMARQLGLSVQDLLTALDLTGLDPFRASHDTLRFVNVVNAIRNSGFGFAELDYLLRHRFIPTSAFIPGESSLAQTLTEVRADLLEVDAQLEVERTKLAQTLTDLPADLLELDAQLEVEREKRQDSSVIDRVAAALALPADLTGALLGRVFHGGEKALKRFTALSVIADTALPLSRANAKPQFETLEKLLKAATIIQTLELPGSLLDWLFRETSTPSGSWLATAPDPPATPVAFASWFSLIQLRQARRELTLEDAGLEAILGAMSAVVVAPDQPSRLAARRPFVNALSTWLGWPEGDVETLVGRPENPADLGFLNARVPEDYRGLDLIRRLQQAIGLLKRLGVTAVQANKWCEASVTDADAKAIRRAAKARHDDQAWLKVTIPLQNTLRDKQREALASYLVARPETWTTNAGKADANDLSSHFLIDVETSSCQLTSRIRQAIGSVQLFAQRCLMGLEDGVRTNDDKWLQWEWMKNFRVWGANRQIWLYPENWIEPELRDGKTPFFKDLENELLQTDLDNAAAEQALLHYLEKLDQVARLEIVGMYEDDEDNTLYVFGRTFSVPHIHYCRRRDGTTQSWTPWEKVEVDIEGDHLIPVIWNRKLMLIWPIFSEKAVETEVEMPPPGHKLKSADRYWEIQLAWSEYQHGRWSGKNLSEPVSFAAYEGEDAVLFGKADAPPQNTTIALAINKGNGDLPPQPEIDDGDGDGSGGQTPPRPTSSTGPRRLVSKDRFAFKALDFGETLVVRGYLRRDYRAEADAGDSQIACPFGEFRFFGCRKIVTTAHQKQMVRQNLALAPTGTTFDSMWFTQSKAGLVLFDGKFPVSPGFTVPTVLSEMNEPGSIAGNPPDTLVNKLDIPVLAQTPTRFRLLTAHQDLQFIGNRPFFFMDGRRAFMVTSIGSTSTRRLSDLAGWVDANVATAQRADYFPPPDPSVPDGNVVTPDPAPGVTPLTVLVPGPGGRRTALEIVPVTFPEFIPKTLLPTFRTTRQYRFVNFHHPFVCDFEKALDAEGIGALLSLSTQSARAAQSFDAYQPEARVLKAYPEDEVEFHTGGAYEAYNWELFFHIPLLIAERLKANQRFAEAQRWFHFIFDPTGASGGDVPQSYWCTKPFHARLEKGYEAESVKTIEEMVAKGVSDELKVAIDVWRTNPFSPHAVARLRTTAYQKTVVMKYIDNLIAWGDQLFRRDTLESLNEATQLYVLAADILGRRPEVIERNLKPAVRTFNTLDLRPGGLGNALEQLELLIPDAGGPGATQSSSQTPDPPSETVLYFCVPENDKLVGYWNTVADRLFKIRHCMNIDGQVRQLPLFEPPIDPALLVRARAAGLSIGEALSDMSVSLPNYRFSVMAQKANELVGEVRNLGAALLLVLEKRDAEALSLLRSGQEFRLLEAVREIRVKQIAEAEANITALQKSYEMAQARKQYYESREFVSDGEHTSRTSLSLSKEVMQGTQALRLLTAFLGKHGTVKLGSPTTSGIEIGGSWVAYGLTAAASALDVTSNVLSVSSQLEGRMADYDRRQDDWDHQANLATIELKQIDQQLVAAEIRLSVAEQELRNHDRQIDNAGDVDRFLRDKFTSQDLYQFMIGRVSGLYFQSYQLAYDLAKRAERCMQHELGVKYGETSFVRFGYWDSLKKGLLAGDHLAHDLKRLEIAYLDGNIREYELTKHVSLVTLDPEQFLALKETGSCEFEIPESLFDLDTPGHHRRRIKMVSVTIPCVTGPYTSVHCKLQLLRNSFRQSTDLAAGYGRLPTDDASSSDDRFVDDRRVLEAIVTSTGQNDAGLFDPGMRDERYLPFEGAGAISRWRLELPTEFKAFDYSTLSDVILHLRYTARDGGSQLSTAATASAKSLLGGSNGQSLFRLFSLRHEFPAEWHRFVSSAASDMNLITVDLAAARFPYFVQSRKITIQTATAIARTKSTFPQVGLVPGDTAPSLNPSPLWNGIANLPHSIRTGEDPPGPWTFGTNVKPALIEDVFVSLAYSAS